MLTLTGIETVKVHVCKQSYLNHWYMAVNFTEQIGIYYR
jgi:hypothetical protein